MRLIHIKTQQFKEFFEEIPPYAIFSHTWSHEEVSFHELQNYETRDKLGYRKLSAACQQSQKDALQFLWFDTCCIDKSSSSELSEAINSMFKWYQDAAICYVYLSDVPAITSTTSKTATEDQENDRLATEDQESDRLACFHRSRWFSRGWTLQELIAPKHVVFFDAGWSIIGDKTSLAQHISTITSIDVELLLGRRTPSDYSVATRMSWAANRTTTRVEDLAYCLLGIFGIYMPLLYGEDYRAFRRLQEEIIKQTCDLTILAWRRDDYDISQGKFQDFFADTPANFRNSRYVQTGSALLWPSSDTTITTPGVQFNKPVELWILKEGSQSPREFGLPVGYIGQDTYVIILRETNLGKRYFGRIGNLILKGTFTGRRIKENVILVHNRYLTTLGDSEPESSSSPSQPRPNLLSGNISDVERPEPETLTQALSHFDSTAEYSSPSFNLLLSSSFPKPSTAMTSFPTDSRKDILEGNMAATDDIPGIYPTYTEAEDTATVYSEETTASNKYGNQLYTVDFSHDLATLVTRQSTDPDTIMRVSEAMPLILQGFARKIGAEATQQTHRDIMRFIFKYKNEIASSFLQHGIADEVEAEEEVASPRADNTIPTSEKVKHWLPGVEKYDASTCPPDIADTANSHDDEIVDGESDHEDDPVPVFAIYRQIIKESYAYKWLESMLEREILFSVPGSSHMQHISKAVFSHKLFRRVSRKASPPRCEITYIVEWDPFDFFHHQNYRMEPSQAMEMALTLTGAEGQVEAVACGEYIRRTWPQTGDSFLILIRSILDSEKGTWLNVVMADETIINGSIQESQVVLNASGQPNTVVEIGEQLAWIGSALRPCHHSGVSSCVPTVSKAVQTGQTESSISILIELGFTIETKQKKKSLDDPGSCWQVLFDNPLVVEGYPIRSRSTQQTGLEMNIDTMAALSGAHKITTFNENIYIKGFDTMLVAVKYIEGTVVWHAFANENGNYIYYHDSRVSSVNIQTCSLPSTTCWRNWTDSRHIIGWCSPVTSYVGLPGAKFSIFKSHLDAPGIGFAFEKVTIGGGKFITASTTIGIGNREKPPRSKAGDNYFRQIRMLASTFVVLYDVEERRAWLVDGASALLHLLRKSLLVDENNGLTLLNTHTNITDETRTTERARSLAILQTNQDLHLYQNPSEVTREIKTKPSGEKEELTTKKETFFLFKDRVNELYSTLEEIINYQTDLSAQNGIGFRVKLSPQRQLEGFDFIDIASSGSVAWPKATTLKPTGKGWVDFVRALHAVTLFGRGFGDLISPSQTAGVCPAWLKVPTGKDYLAVSTYIIQDLVGNSISQIDSLPWRVVEDIYLHSPDKSFETCQCTGTNSESCCDRVQILIPKNFLGTRGFRSPPELPLDGAVIFGHSHKYPLRWRGTGNPIEGEPEAELEVPAHDSGIDTSVSSTTSMELSNLRSSSLADLSANAGSGSSLSPSQERGRFGRKGFRSKLHAFIRRKS